MIIQVTFNTFVDAFANAGRADNFSYLGLQSLLLHLENYEDDTGEQIELDVIALCCEYGEYSDIEEFHADYSIDDYPDIDSIYNQTEFIPVGDEGFIIQLF